MIVAYDRHSLETRYDIGDTVYLKTDADQRPRIVVSITLYPRSNVLYNLSCGVVVSGHYEFELQSERDELQTLGVTAAGNADAD